MKHTITLKNVEMTCTLSNEDIEKIYRLREREYRIEDAKRHIEESHPELVETYCDKDYDALVELFNDAFDCNIAENDTWECVIESYLSK